MWYEDFLRDSFDESYNKPRVMSIELALRIQLDPEMDI